MKVRDLMSYPIVTVRPDVSVLEAIKLMLDGKKGSVIVSKGGLLKECLGIVTTSRIFLGVFAKGLDPAEIRVSEIMTPSPLITIGPNSTAREAAELMMANNIRRLPVLENDTLVGVITSKDLLKCVNGS